MAEDKKGLDLKNPGGKEILVAGGIAVVLGVIYLKLNANKTPASGGGSPGVPASGHGLGSPGNTPAFFPTGSTSTGNVFTDVSQPSPFMPNPQQVTVPPVSSGGGGRTGGGASGPPTRRMRVDLPMPQLHGTTQGAHAILGGAPSSGPPVAAAPGGPVTFSPGASGVYSALVHAGLSPTQAAGVMGNIINESGYNPEAIGDQGTSFGLVQWHFPSHSNARGFVTGNVAHDFQNQINAIVQVVKGLGLPANASAGQVAATFASQFEGCVGCQPGGPQYNQRVANANNVWQQIQAGLIKEANAAKPQNLSTGGGNIPPWELKGSGLTEAQARALTPAKLEAYLAKYFPALVAKPKATPARRPAPRRPAARPAARRPTYHAVGNLAAAISRFAATFRPRPAPRPKPLTQAPHHQRFVGGY